MAPRSYTQAPPGAWERVAAATRDRRTELGLSQAEAVDRSGGRISLSVWSILEGARQTSGRMEERSLTGAALALRWPADAMQRILAGEDPATFDDQPPPTGGGNVVPLAPRRAEELDEEQVELAALVGQLPPDKRAAIEQLVRTMLDGTGDR